MVTLEELHRFTVQMGESVDRKTIWCLSIWNSVELCNNVKEKKQVFKTNCLKFATSDLEDVVNVSKSLLWSDETKM